MSEDNLEVLSANGGEDVVLAGGQKVSMQLLQQMYKEVTGRTERITRQISCNHRTGFADLENLNSKMEHLLEQYHVAEKSCNVSFFHGNDATERYSSFDRARTCEVASLSALENVRLEYDFLIILPIAKKPQPYKITVDVQSRVALSERMREKSGIQARLFAAFSDQTGNIAVEYVDYAVARNFMDAVSQWFEGLPQSESSKILLAAKKWSYHFDWILKYFTATILSLFFLLRFQGDASSLLLSSQLFFWAVAFCIIFIFSGVSYHLGTVIEGSVDSYNPISYLKINRGDDRIIAAFEKARSRLFVKAFTASILALLLNLVGSWLSIKLNIK